MRGLKRLWFLTEYALAQILFFLIGIAPLGVLLILTEVLARFFFLILFHRRRIAMDNLLRAGVCAQPDEARRMTLQCFRTFVAMVLETMAARRRIRADNWKDHVHLEITREAADLLRKPGQGLIVASAHIGNWDVVARAISAIKPVSAIYRPFNNPYLDRSVRASRSGMHLHLISKFMENPLRLLQILSRGEILAIMIDQHESDGLPVQFFGRPARTTRSVAMLHFTTRVPVLFAFSIRTGPLQYELHVVGPLVHERTGDRKRDGFEFTQRLTHEIETIARRYPEQYMWGHRRWK